MMVYMGDADAYVAGITVTYGDVLRPALKIFGTRPDVSRGQWCISGVGAR